MYRFNSNNLKNIRTHLGVKHLDIANVLGIVGSSWNYKYNNDSITCRELIKLCDAYHLPILHFIIVDDVEYDCLPIENKKPIINEINFMLPSLLMKNKQCNILTTLGVRFDFFKKLLDSPSEVDSFLMFKQFLDWCNKAQINASAFVKDESRPIPNIPGYSDTASYSEILSTIQAQQNEINRLRMDNIRMSNQIKAICDVLSPKVKAKDYVNYIHIAEDNSVIGMVAESDNKHKG